MPDIFEMFNEEAVSSNSNNDVIESVEGVNSFFDSSKTFVVSLGGSIVIKEKINTGLLGKLSHSFSNLMKEGYKFVLVVGGGRTAREFQAAGKALGASNFFLDEIGIMATQLNAKLVSQAFENAFPEPLKKIYQARQKLEKGLIPVFGGILPGITTDTVAALIAESVNANFMNLSNVDGVYSSDPRENPKAKFYSHLTHSELIKIVSRSTSLNAKPGQNVVLDLPSCLILKRSKIKSFILSAESIENIENAVHGTEFKGTLVLPDEE